MNTLLRDRARNDGSGCRPDEVSTRYAAWMAIFLAIRGGLQDAREGKPPYFWGICTDNGERESMVKDGWRHIATVFILARA